MSVYKEAAANVVTGCGFSGAFEHVKVKVRGVRKRHSSFILDRCKADDFYLGR